MPIVHFQLQPGGKSLVISRPNEPAIGSRDVPREMTPSELRATPPPPTAMAGEKWFEYRLNSPIEQTNQTTP